MAEYQKYMFDNFIIENDRKETAVSADDVDVVSEIPELTPVLPEETAAEVAEVEEIKPEPPLPPEPPVEEVKITEPSYSKEELDAAVKLAEEAAYEKGKNAAAESELSKQNILLEEIRNQLSAVFSAQDTRLAEIEKSALSFAVSLVRKLLPTLEEEQAAAEVKNFMAENFANFAGQDTLSFAFNPETVSLVADSIGRLAEQNDFEGKIAVHKDGSLGPSDCRIEWKNGGVERKVSKILDKVDTLINDNTEERENG